MLLNDVDKHTAAYGNPQPLTIGGAENGTVVSLTNVIITASSITPEVSAEGTNPNNGNVTYNALVDINDYLSSLGK